MWLPGITRDCTLKVTYPGLPGTGQERSAAVLRTRWAARMSRAAGARPARS